MTTRRNSSAAGSVSQEGGFKPERSTFNRLSCFFRSSIFSFPIFPVETAILLRGLAILTSLLCFFCFSSFCFLVFLLFCLFYLHST
ncbi:hypothetical protein [Aedoeadaptatus coli]|uniref:hypothetical protein n=1 Tax=Aedoeadaptatus coli TaxID=2058292 RepID=UPI003AA80D81